MRRPITNGRIARSRALLWMASRPSVVELAEEFRPLGVQIGHCLAGEGRGVHFGQVFLQPPLQVIEDRPGRAHACSGPLLVRGTNLLTVLWISRVSAHRCTSLNLASSAEVCVFLLRGYLRLRQYTVCRIIESGLAARILAEPANQPVAA